MNGFVIRRGLDPGLSCGVRNEASGTRSRYSRRGCKRASRLSGGGVRTETGTAAIDRQPCLLRLPCRGSGPVSHKDAALICRPAPGAIRCAASQHPESDSIFFSSACRLFRLCSSWLAVATGCDKGIICRQKRSHCPSLVEEMTLGGTCTVRVRVHSSWAWTEVSRNDQTNMIVASIQTSY